MKSPKYSCCLFLLACIYLLNGCTKSSGTSDPVPSPSPGPSSFHGVRIYIISAGDIHEYSANLAGLASLIKSVKDTAPYVYTVLAGDFFMYHHSYNVTHCDGRSSKAVPPDLKVPDDSNHAYDGLACSRLIESLNFDAIVPGNHDWVYGIDLLAGGPLKSKIVACNIGDPRGLAVGYLSFSSEKGKYTMNVIGVAADDNIHSMGQEVVNVYSIQTSTSISKIKAAMATANINVLLTHLLDADDSYAFTTLKNTRGETLFDVLCGGHTHEVFAYVKGTAAYVKAGLYGINAGISCIWWDTVKMETIKKSSRIICLENYAKDIGTQTLIDSLHRVYPHY
jgi:2',3'-cyclic-nucleotide 2'-phosphodiesterase (5'-nucleotidase family)